MGIIVNIKRLSFFPRYPVVQMKENRYQKLPYELQYKCTCAISESLVPEATDAECSGNFMNDRCGKMHVESNFTNRKKMRWYQINFTAETE